MATHSSVLAWRIPGTGEPSGLLSMGSHRVSRTQLKWLSSSIFPKLLLLLSSFSHVWLCATPEMAAHQALPSLGFSRQEHWSHFPLQCMKVKSEREVAQSCPTLATPWTAAHQAPPPMGFSRQEYWSGVPSPSPYSLYCTLYPNDLFILYLKTWNF